jgi:phage terminase small subunit
MDNTISKFDKLKTRQKVFILEYLKDFNGTQAAIRSGYSKKTSGQIAEENLKKPEIKAALNEKLDEILNDKQQIAVETIRETKKIANAKLTDYLEYDQDSVTVKPSDEIDSAALSSIEIDNGKVKIKLHDKMKALDLLAKYAELYRETEININPSTIIYLDNQDEKL